MKGKLKQTKEGWFVNNGSKTYPLHPKTQKSFDNLSGSISGFFGNNEEVEYQLVREYIDTHTNQVQTFAMIV